MGSLWLPVISNFFMEDFEEMVISRVPYGPIYWFHNIDSMFVIWPHGPEKLMTP
jgi:hypothetical protein